MRQIRVMRAVAAMVLSAVIALTALPPRGMAQDLFAPRLYVNDLVITEFEVIQRAMFLKILGAPGDLTAESIKALTEDRLRFWEAKRLGLKVSEEEVLQGMNEFASRANLTAEQLVGELEKVGISAETYRDFVVAGLLWRQAIRARFGGQISVSEADVDKAIAKGIGARAMRVLASEIVIPFEEGGKSKALSLARGIAGGIKSEEDFAKAAQQYSAAPTAGRGGQLDWLPVANLPPEIAAKISGLTVGRVSAPIEVPNAIVLIFLRDLAEDTSEAPVSTSVEYARFLIGGSAEEIAKIRASVDVCMDLNKFAKGLPEEQLVIETKSMSEIPQDIGLELAKLDPGEISTALTRSGGRLLLMLCSRNPVAAVPPSREDIKNAILDQKVQGLAEGYMAELKAAAIIREP